MAGRKKYPWKGPGKDGKVKAKHKHSQGPSRAPWNALDAYDRDLLDVLGRTMAVTGGNGRAIGDDHDDDTLFGTIRGGIVGVRYYMGEVNNNEMVALVREPQNQYDSNAIKVLNVWGEQVGHIKREMAAALAPLVDKNLARIEGVVPFGKTNMFRIPVDIAVWGQADHKSRVVDKLEYHGVRFEGVREQPSQPSQPGRTKVYRPRASAAAPVQLTKAEMKNEMDQLFDDLKQVEKTTMKEPAKAIASPLYPHQKQALNWMCARENSDHLPPFWKQHGASHYLNTITNFISSTRPPTVRGGILADEMGLGKTLEMIALILTNFHEGMPLAVPNSESVQDVIDVNSDSDSEVCKVDSTTHRGQGDSTSTAATLDTGPPLGAESEKPIEEEMTTNPDIGVLGKTKHSNAPVEEVIVVESLPDNEVVIILDDDDVQEQVAVIAAPVPDVQEVTSTGRPKRSSKKPARYVFSSSDVDEESDGDVPKKKAKKTSKKAEASASHPSEVSQGCGVNSAGLKVTKSKAGAISKKPKMKGAATKTKPRDLPDPQLPSLPQLPTLPGYPKAMPYVTSTCSVTTTSSSPSIASHSGTSSGPSGQGSGPSKGPRPTLIICPLSVISNWQGQFEEHVRSDVDLKLYTHYGSDRAKSHSRLMQEDVVITTYSTLAAEFKSKKGKSPLHKVDWLRVVLDEGHMIRNPNTLQTLAVLELKARRKWVLTGTPIQNSIKDLWTLMSFLGLEPFKSDRMWWQRTIVRPINQGDKSAVKRISQLMEQIALRRTKSQKVDGQLLVDLPTKSVFIQKVELSPDERAVYDSMAKEGRLAIGKYFNTGTLLTNYGNVLAILLRLRQLCCHPALIAAAVALKEADENGEGSEGISDLRKKLVDTLLKVLSQGADEECCICLESLRTPVITPCAHVFCNGCINDVIDTGVAAKCPLCRGNISKETLVEVPKEVQQEKAAVTEGDWHSSAKVDAVLECLMKEREKDPSTKSLVVSQFVGLLDLVEKPLRDSGFNFVRLDGSMTMKLRTRAMEAFRSPRPDAPTIMLLSLRAGGVGVNLTVASRMYLMDPAWNPAAEDQCFDRCHRLGQTKDVIITKFVVKDSIEEKMVELQDKKRKLMSSAFSKKLSTEEKRQARINDIKSLIDLSAGAGTSA